MRFGKHTYTTEQMIALTPTNIKQFSKLYLERSGIQAAEIAPIEYEKWISYLDFQNFEKWDRYFLSENMQEKQILIVGDYDVDGIMASKIALWICEMSGVEIVDIYIPNRFTDGYGLNKNIVQKAIEDGYDVILTVDNGVGAHEAIVYAKEHGIDVLLTDHHHIQEVIPDATLILHPDCGNVNHQINMCGAAVIFALAYRLFREESKKLIPYVMLATLADSIELKYLNRAFVQEGLLLWQYLDDPFLHQMANELAVDTADAQAFAWKLIPVLNAIGRMGDVNEFADVLFWKEANVHPAIQKSIEINAQRKFETEKIIEEVLHSDVSAAVICQASEDWHQGVLGIAASRIVELFQKPVLLFSINQEQYKGSGRSPENFHLFHFLNTAKDSIHTFGGHAYACGLTLYENQYQQMKVMISKLDPISPLTKSIDFDVTQLMKNDFPILYQEVSKLSPFGKGIEVPQFHLLAKEKQIRIIGKNREHVKCILPNQFQLLFFNEKDSERITEQSEIHIIGSLSTNSWQEKVTYQSIVSDWWIEGIEFFYPNQLTEQSQIYTQAVIISDIPKSVQDFHLLQNEVQQRKLCVLQWQDAQKHVILLADEQIRRIYKYFLQKKQTPIDHAFYTLMKQNGLEKKQVNFVIKVFLELEFVIIESGVLKIRTGVVKKQLSDSPLYQQMQYQQMFIKQIVYASNQERKERFEHMEE